MNKEEMTQEQRAQLIEKLRTEYKDLNGKIARLNAFLCDINFVKKVPDIIEQELMKGQLRAMENYLSNLRGRIIFQEARQKAEKSLEEWKNMKGKVVNTLCGPVHLSNTNEEHHCGQDASCPVSDGSAVVQDPNESQPAEVLRTKEDMEKKLGIHIHEGNAPKGQCGCMDMKSLLDMQVIGVGNGKCEGCPQDHYGTPCVKVELVGGAYICLAPLPNSIATE